MSNGEVISKVDARTMIRAYKDSVSSETKRAFLFDKSLIMEVLNGANCEGMRIYMGLNDDEDLNVIVVGTDGDGRDLTDNPIMEYSKPCPPECDASSYFNT